MPGDADDVLAAVERVPGEQAGRHDERLSDLRVTDAVGVPPGACGDEVDSGPVRVLLQPLRDALAFEPRCEEPGGLRALPGEHSDDHHSILPMIRECPLAMSAQKSRDPLCEPDTFIRFRGVRPTADAGSTRCRSSRG